MDSQRIMLTLEDFARLRQLLASDSIWAVASRDNVRALRSELARAELVSAAEAPTGLVRVDSTVRRRELRTGRILRVTVVLPQDADFELGRVSVLAPLGTAVLGCRAGDQFTWEMPRGPRSYRIEKVMRRRNAA